MPKTKRLARSRPRIPAPESRRSAFEALSRAMRHHKDGEFEAAEREYRRALKQGEDVLSLRSFGKLLLLRGRPEEAVPLFARAAGLAPEDPDVLVEHGVALKDCGRAIEALPVFRRALSRDGRNVGALTGLGSTLCALGDKGEAVATLRRAVEVGPESAPAHAQLVKALIEDQRLVEAEEASRLAVEAAPGSAEVNFLRGLVLAKQGRLEEALASYRTASGCAPQDARFRAYIGGALATLGREEEAIVELQATLALDPDHPLANMRLGAILAGRQRHGEALPHLRRAATVDADSILVLHELCEAERTVCDWQSLAAHEARLRTLALKEGKLLPPFHAFSLGAGPADQRACAERWARDLAYDVRDVLPPPPQRSLDRKIRVGYLSRDFRSHATAYLAAELFEQHDRDHFEVFAYAYGVDDGSHMRRRLVAAFDRFVDVDAMSDKEAAEAIRADGVDILVDLKGYTLKARTEILALRPAPVQVNFLGFPGTMGADFVDYIIADRIIAPPQDEDHFAEAVVRLPNTYQPNDTKRAIAPERPSRAACGLPEDAFVFASFNHVYKITPQVFALWMRLLKAVPGSVLWLLESNPIARENLSAAAEREGVQRDRLVFAPKWKLASHLARIPNADLFLDTLPVNAHTTASDCLWAGLPVLTCAGDSMVSRVAASLLEAVGLPELVTRSLDEYEALALCLAHEPDRLAALRARLARGRHTAPLFDIARYTKNLEKAFETMHEIHTRGENPRPIEVEDAGSQTNAPAPAAAPARPSPSVATAERPAVPRVINLGSGKDWREDCLNIDVDATWAPDVVVDLAAVDLAAGPLTLTSARFGTITLAAGSVDRIIANDVLEHVPDLVALMTTCLALLAEGGTFEINVPYDLSHGAWQDPTHVRAFNERSWLYYTDWFWYLGWSQARFRLQSLVMRPSSLGREMRARGATDAELARTPRAVDAMSVTLKKTALDEADRQAWHRWRSRKDAATIRRAHIQRASPPLPFAGGWRAHADAHAVWIVSPEGYFHHHAFDDVAAALSHAFGELGGSAPLVRRPEDLRGRAPIVLGAHLLPMDAGLPEGSIILNLEQAGAGNPNFTDGYRALLRRHPVLDYSPRNARALAQAGVESLQVLPIGYAPVLTRVAHRAEKDIDVLFYGSMNERRRAVLAALEGAGLTVVHRFGVYGAERDELVARAKLVLNMHYYDTAIFEVVRVSWLLANGACVVTEGEEDDEDIAPFREGLALADEEALVGTCRALLQDEPCRRRLARSGLALMLRRRQSDLLGQLMAS